MVLLVVTIGYTKTIVKHLIAKTHQETCMKFEPLSCDRGRLVILQTMPHLVIEVEF